MQKIKSNQSGFGAVEIAVVILVLAALGAGGWLAYEEP